MDKEVENRIKALKDELENTEPELVRIFNEILDIEFLFNDGLEGWNQKANKIKALVKESMEMWEVRRYLENRLDEMEQTDLDDYKEGDEE